MPNKIQIKRSSTASATPSGAQLDAGELAINTADGRLYAKNSAGTVINLPVTSISGQTIAPGQVDVDNLRLDANTLSSTNTNGNIIVSPNGTGKVLLGRTTADGTTNEVQCESLTIRGSDTAGNGITPTFTSTGQTYFGNATGDVGVLCQPVPAATFDGTHPLVFSFTGCNEPVTQYTPILFTTGYFAQFWLATTGDIGVGVSSPAARFDVRRDVSYALLCDANYVTAAFGPREVDDGYCTVTHSWTTLGAGSYWQSDYSSGGMSFTLKSAGVDSGIAFVILSSGFVGINTTTPAAPLHAVSTGTGAAEIARFRRQDSGNTDGAHLSIHADNTNNLVQLRSAGTSAGSFSFYSGTTERVTIATSGEMAINSNTVLHAGNYQNYVTKTLAVFTAKDNHPPAANYATLDTRNSMLVLDFDAATEEYAVFLGVIRENASFASGLTVRLSWMATTATSGNCIWGVQFEKMTTDLDADSWDPVATGTGAVTTATNATSGIPTTTSIPMTAVDSLAAGDFFRLRVYRDADNASDTMAGDAELLSVELRVT